MSLGTPETHFAKKYRTEYDLIYGQLRMDTGYNFNSDVTELYSDNIFENIISATDSDKYFRNFYNSRGNLVPVFLNDNITLGERDLTPTIGLRNVKTHYNKSKFDIMFTFYDNLHNFEEKV
jgi:hypothetical protein